MVFLLFIAVAVLAVDYLMLRNKVVDMTGELKNCKNKIKNLEDEKNNVML